MKTNILLFLEMFLIPLIQTRAQTVSDFSWFTDNMQWYYGISEDGMGSDEGCISMSVAGDTLLDGRMCKRLMIASCNGTYETMYEYVYYENEKVYYYNLEAQDFFLLLDFSAQIGDTIWVHKTSFIPNPGFDPYQRWKIVNESFENTDCYPFMAYQILSIDTVILDNQPFRRQLAKSITVLQTENGLQESWWEFPGWSHPEYNYIIEKVGSLSGFFGESRGVYPEWGKCWLRCFSVAEKTYITDGSCDNAAIEKPLKQEAAFWQIYPQPATSIVRVCYMASEGLKMNGTWRLFDLTGKPLQHGAFFNGSFSISLNDNTSGLYFIEINIGKGKVYRLKCLMAKHR